MGKLLLKQDEMILLKNSEAVKNIENDMGICMTV